MVLCQRKVAAEELRRCLQSSHKSDKAMRQSIEDFSEALSRNPSYNQTVRDLVAMLYQHLEDGGRLPIFAAWCIDVLAERASAFRESLLEHGAVELILAILRMRDEGLSAVAEAKEHAARCLGTLCTRDIFASNVIRERGGIQELSHLLRTGSASQQRFTIYSLGRLCYDNPVNKELIRTNGCLRDVVQRLRNPGADSILDVAPLALARMAADHDENCWFIHAEGGVQVLEDIVQRGVEPACSGAKLALVELRAKTEMGSLDQQSIMLAFLLERVCYHLDKTSTLFCFIVQRLVQACCPRSPLQFAVQFFAISTLSHFVGTRMSSLYKLSTGWYSEIGRLLAQLACTAHPFHSAAVVGTPRELRQLCYRNARREGLPP